MHNFKKVVHLSSAHSRYDIRIFNKMCRTIAQHEFDVYLIIADGEGDEVLHGVKIIDVGIKQKTRILRMFKTVNQVFDKAIEIDADLYHLHDPELMRIGNKLKRRGKLVIFDAHEDLPKQILSKPYLNFFTKKFVHNFFSYYEKYSCKKYNFIITATQAIKNKFKKIQPNTCNVNNYPIIGELSGRNKWNEKEHEITYVGGISSIRGIKELITSLALIDSNVVLNLVGEFHDKNLQKNVENLPGWEKVKFHGFKDRKSVTKILSQSVAGIVTFLPAPNHIDAQPNKMFEYMSAGIPIIASNFPIWKEMIDYAECGICVNPEDPREIAKAILFCIHNLDLAEQMGINGLNAIEDKYNWASEGKKLLKIYRKLLQ